MESPLAGTAALVTGASSGIAAATARRLAQVQMSRSLLPQYQREWLGQYPSPAIRTGQSASR